MAILEGISAVKTAFEVAKSIGDLVKKPKIDPNEVASQLLLLQQLMLTSQRALLDAQEETQALKSQVSDQTDTKAIGEDLEWVSDGSFWIRKSEKGRRDIKYCPQCWGDSKKLMPLNCHNPRGLYRCDLHNTFYETQAHRNHTIESHNRSSGGFEF